MDDADLGDTGFGFELPVWIPVVASTYRNHGLPGGVAMLTSPKTGKLLAIFTDDDLARRFLADWDEPDRTMVEVADKTELTQLLKAFQRTGVMYVGIDCPAVPGPGWRTGRLCPIALAIAAAES